MPNDQPRRSGWGAKFVAAFRGIACGVRGHRSFYVHLPMAVVVIATAALLRMDLWEWAVLLLCISGVLVAELLNSALELLARSIHDGPDPRLRDALDAAAGAVLLASIAAAVIGAAVILHRIGERAGWWA